MYIYICLCVCMYVCMHAQAWDATRTKNEKLECFGKALSIQHSENRKTEMLLKCTWDAMCQNIWF